MLRFSLAWALGVVLACGGERDAAGPDDEEFLAGNPSSDESALTEASCAATDSALFFHGMNGFGRELVKPGICGPDLARTGGFWGPAHAASAPAAKLVSGYSAGRIPMLLRMMNGAAREKTAVLLDGSYADGRRFSNKTGPEIVTQWLKDDAERRFVLVYSPASAGYREYLELAASSVASQFRACPVHGGHLELPNIVGSQMLLDLDAWLAERCR